MWTFQRNELVEFKKFQAGPVYVYSYKLKQFVP
jgi:hypothetical protein